MQLVAYGAQDVYITGNPQITFFKLLYRRHTNFSIEAIQQTFQGSVGLGQRVQAIVSRNGDLLHKLYLEVKVPAASDNEVYVNKLGYALIKSAEVEIGGQRIDKIYGRWMDMWHGLTCPAEKAAGFEQMAGVSMEKTSDIGFAPSADTVIYVPINFWFSKGSAGAALPLIALQYHEVRITLELASAADITRGDGGGDSSTSSGYTTVGSSAVYPELTKGSTIAGSAMAPTIDAKLYADFIYLDTEERRRFAQTSHEYLIEQLQFTGQETMTNGRGTYRLNFNHPCKAFYWHLEKAGIVTCDPFWSGSAEVATGDAPNTLLDSMNPVKSVKLQLNGHERFSERPGSYFSTVQPFQHHTRIPQMAWNGLYSFAISPEEHQPSGALNMSRIDTGRLVLELNDADDYNLFVYAINYNVLRILSGMGGLAFSN
jgi:hypothetical protein